MLEGKWTITPIAGDGIVVDFTGDESIPVVPVDDAAVERVAAMLAEMQGYHPAGPLELDRRAARRLLRAAAGETNA